ncbi:polyprenyl synthetase family protein [Nonomuraea typhae]|uniref:Polyprenyl synthetase family protein n=1 Tax=Nonomuraea typhae TaxID=2603600 RepID=A0ABW7Z9C5_9ACTN
MPPSVWRMTPEAMTVNYTAVRQGLDSVLVDFLREKLNSLPDSRLENLIDHLCEFVIHGGKRLRPLLCYYGWETVEEAGERTSVLRAAASLELFHAFALIHDDIMDASAMRRGRPTLHKALGVNDAILLGDIALVWHDEMLHASGVDPQRLIAVRSVVEAMRAEALYGQQLDLLATGGAKDDLDLATTVVRYKTAKYTVERPLHVGAALAGGGPEVLRSCTAYALPIGEAFQLRDDVLGVFGHPDVTGKSAVEDLREGKVTVLIATALSLADTKQIELLNRLLGNPELDESGAERVRELLVDTGALKHVEDMIRRRREEGLAALEAAPFRPEAVAALREIAYATTERVS